MKPLKPMIIIVIGTAITISGAIITAVGTYRQNKSSSQKSDSIKKTGENTFANTATLKDQNKELRHQVFNLEEQSKEQISQIQSLATQNAELSSKLTQSAIDTYSSLTGGDGYLSVNIANIGVGKFVLTVQNKTKHIIPNVFLRVENYSEILKCEIRTIDGIKRINSDCVEANTVTVQSKSYNVNDIHHIPVSQFLIRSADTRLLGMYMYTPNNMFYVNIFYNIKSDTEVDFGYRILKDVNGEYITIASNGNINDKYEIDQWNSLFTLPHNLPIFKN